MYLGIVIKTKEGTRIPKQCIMKISITKYVKRNWAFVEIETKQIRSLRAVCMFNRFCELFSTGEALFSGSTFLFLSLTNKRMIYRYKSLYFLYQRRVSGLSIFTHKFTSDMSIVWQLSSDVNFLTEPKQIKFGKESLVSTLL